MTQMQLQLNVLLRKETLKMNFWLQGKGEKQDSRCDIRAACNMHAWFVQNVFNETCVDTARASYRTHLHSHSYTHRELFMINLAPEQNIHH